MTEAILFTLVSMQTWLTPSPQHAQGLIVNYGNDSLALANAEYRGYTLKPFRDHCGLSLMSPSDLGKIVWLRLPDDTWYGPCSAVDVGARHDWYTLIYINEEIAEITTTQRELMGFTHGQRGEIYIGLCPPTHDSYAAPYKPILKWDDSGGLDWREWPRQQMPTRCDDWGSSQDYDGAK